MSNRIENADYWLAVAAMSTTQQLKADLQRRDYDVSVESVTPPDGGKIWKGCLIQNDSTKGRRSEITSGSFRGVIVLMWLDVAVPPSIPRPSGLHSL